MTDNYERARRRLESGGVLILDGGVSTELQRRGVQMANEVWSGRVTLDHWQALVDMHRAYIDSGADIITANTYASSRLMLEPAGLGGRVEEINRRSVEAALVAREQSGASEVIVAGSMSHAIPTQIAGHPLKADDAPGASALAAAFKEMVSVFEETDVDLLLLEMMSKPERMLPLFDALSQNNLPAWCGFSVKRDGVGELRAIHDESVSFAANIASAMACTFDVWGVMHTSADIIGAALSELKSAAPKPLMAYPDSGYIEMPNWQFVDVMAPERLADFAAVWISEGAQIVGGCCGLGPEHIAAIAHLRK